MRKVIDPTLKHNLKANLLDGGFFGMALGFASFVTIIPLFVSQMTDSAVLIGLIPAIHSVGWQIPQLLTADRVARQSRYKPMVLLMTLHERIPFLGLALVAFLLPRIGSQWGLILTFGFLIWQGLGGGVAATAWQAMIGKIIPPRWRGTFFGAQSSAANMLSAVAAVIAGLMLEKLPSPFDYGLLFLLAAASMGVSFIFLSLTRESERLPAPQPLGLERFSDRLKSILSKDHNFRGYLVVRMISQFAGMAVAFYTVYAIRHHGMSELEVGIMTSLFLGAQIVLNPLMGWLGDRWSHRAAMSIGFLAFAASAGLAWWSPSPAWFYLAFILAGLGNVGLWTIALALTLEFGAESERPAYIGLANTLIAPATIVAPILGGWLADAFGYSATFQASMVGSLIALAVLLLFVRDPRHVARPQTMIVEDVM
jgi:MFS family permease